MVFRGVGDVQRHSSFYVKRIVAGAVLVFKRLSTGLFNKCVGRVIVLCTCIGYAAVSFCETRPRAFKIRLCGEPDPMTNLGLAGSLWVINCVSPYAWPEIFENLCHLIARFLFRFGFVKNGTQWYLRYYSPVNKQV